MEHFASMFVCFNSGNFLKGEDSAKFAKPVQGHDLHLNSQMKVFHRSVNFHFLAKYLEIKMCQTWSNQVDSKRIQEL